MVDASRDACLRWLLDSLAPGTCSLRFLPMRRDESSQFEEVRFHLLLVRGINLLGCGLVMARSLRCPLHGEEDRPIVIVVNINHLQALSLHVGAKSLDNAAKHDL